jgi:hypothetical protein
MMTSNDARDPLLTLNNQFNYYLLNPLLLALGDTNEANPYIENQLNTLYFDHLIPPSPLTLLNSISFLSLNIRSLIANHQYLNPIISNLINIGSNIKAIALQETWNVPYPQLVHIDGFNFISKSRKNGRGGGVGFYLCDKLKYKVVKDLSTFIDNEFESLTVEIQINRKRILLSNYYKPPQVNNDNFLLHLNQHLGSLFQHNINTYVFFDTNINLLKLPNSNLAKEYLEVVHSNGVLQLISKATRILNNTYSLIIYLLIISNQNLGLALYCWILVIIL